MSFYHSKLNFLVNLMVLALLNACTTNPYFAPVKTDNQEFVENRRNPTINKDNQVINRDIKKHHVVKNWRILHSMDLSSGYGYQRMALWNQKSPSYIISVGRKIKHPDPEDRDRDKKQPNTMAKKSKSQHQKPIVSIDNKKMVKLNFGWPIKGRVLKSFSPPHNKGINIAVKKEQQVKATEEGKVVYGGQGLLGFGKLIIIKHNDDYLSAYTNSSRLLVNEGQYVQKGQVIAEVGVLGFKPTSLHFEIRKNGKPVNPLKLLPKK